MGEMGVLVLTESTARLPEAFAVIMRAMEFLVGTGCYTVKV